MASQADLLNLIGTLPPGANPYTAISGFLWSSLSPPVPRSLSIQLYALSGVLGVCLLLVVLSLGIRALGRAFWLVRMGPTGLLTPHWSVGWSLWAVALLACLEAQIWITLEYLKQDEVIYSYFLCGSSPAWMGGWTALWSLAISYITHRGAMGKLHISSRTAVALNVLAVLFPVAYLAALLPFGVEATITYRSVLDIFASLESQLQEGAATYDPATFNLLALAPGLAGLQEMARLGMDLVKQLRNTFTVLAVSGGVIIFILIVVCWLHLRSLSRVITESTSIMHTLESSSSQEHALLRSYRNLKYTSLSFIFICLLFTAVCLYTAIDTQAALTDPVSLQIDLLMPLYVFAILGLPTAILLFVRSLDVLEPTHTVISHGAHTTTSIGVGGKSLPSHQQHRGHPSTEFEMVPPKHQIDPKELFKIGSNRAARHAPLERNAEGWFRELEDTKHAEPSEDDKIG